MQIGFHVARTQQRSEAPRRVAIFSAEMTAWQVILREAAKLSRIPAGRIKRGEVKDADVEYLHGILRDMADYPLLLDDTTAISSTEMRSKLEQWTEQDESLGLVVFDHMNLNGGDREYERVGSLSTSLKVIARDFNVPVLALAQLNRKVEERDPPVPILSDLRSSGSIEQDAQNVWFIYRESREGPHDTQIIVAKARDGETGTVNVIFDPRFTEFRSSEDDADVQDEEF